MQTRGVFVDTSTASTANYPAVRSFKLRNSSPLRASVPRRAVNSRCSTSPSRPVTHPPTLLLFRLAVSIAFSTALAPFLPIHILHFDLIFPLRPRGPAAYFGFRKLHSAELSFGRRPLARSLSRLPRHSRFIPTAEAPYCRESLSMLRLQVNFIVTARVTGAARRELTCNYCLATASLPSLKLHQRRCTEAYSLSTATAVMRLGISDSISEATSN